MKKIFKVCLFILLIISTLCFAIIGIVFITPPKTKLNEEYLIKTTNFTIYYDINLKQANTRKNSTEIIDITKLNENTKNAFIAIEDKNFYKHNGIDLKRIIGATINNLKKGSFAQGASTISQQLIKNTHLSSEKTLSRKIDEIKLAKKLEKNYTKDQILEMYLNNIYFGENCYGLAEASQKYFSKSPYQLTLDESATLAATIVSPSKLNPIRNIELCRARRDLILDLMHEQNLISMQDVIISKNKDIILNINDNYDSYDSYFTAAQNELNEISQSNPYLFKNCKVFTYFDEDCQKALIQKTELDCDVQAMIIDNKTSMISAFYSTCGEIKRSPASTAKSWLVYAPAIEENIINECTIIEDKQISFDNYAPKNYKDKYYGNITAKTALAKSLNVPAVKILNSLTINKAKEYSKKLNFDIKSNGLGIALGSFDNDVYLKQATAPYTCFANFGIYKKPCFIRKILDYNNNIIYENKEKATRVYSKSTASIINKMLTETTISGSAKSLYTPEYQICAKTGTNGNKDGNLDAYSISYTTKHTLSCWFGNADNSLLSNQVNGSTHPTLYSKSVYEQLYKDEKPENFEEKDVETVYIDKYLLEKNGEIKLATKHTPQKYKLKATFKKDNLPTSESQVFTKPKIKNYDIILDDNNLKLKIISENFIYYKIFLNDNGTKKCVYDGNKVFETKLEYDKPYNFIILPYSKFSNDTIVSGDEISLNTIKIKKPFDFNEIIDKNWWIE